MAWIFTYISPFPLQKGFVLLEISSSFTEGLPPMPAFLNFPIVKAYYRSSLPLPIVPEYFTNKIKQSKT